MLAGYIQQYPTIQKADNESPDELSRLIWASAFSTCTKSHFHMTSSFVLEYICTYKTVPFSTFSNTEIQEGKNKTLGSRQSASDCVLICDESPTCFGFTYFSSPSYCRFFSALPILATDEQATMYMKTCPPGTVSNGM